MQDLFARRQLGLFDDLHANLSFFGNSMFGEDAEGSVGLNCVKESASQRPVNSQGQHHVLCHVQLECGSARLVPSRSKDSGYLAVEKA